MFFRSRSNDLSKKEKNDKSKNDEIHSNNISTQIFIIGNEALDLSQESPPHFESKLFVIQNPDASFSEHYVSGTVSNDIFCDIDDENLKFPVSYSDDDDSSISDIKSTKFFEDDFYYNDDWNNHDKAISYSVEDSQHLSMEAVSTPNTIYENSQYLISNPVDNDFQQHFLKYSKVDYTEEYPLNDILDNQFDESTPQTVNIKIENELVLSVVEFQSTSFLEPEIVTFSQLCKEKPQCFTMFKTEDLWEFNDNDIEEQSEFMDCPTGKEECINKYPKTLSIIEKELLKYKIKWLIPLEPTQLETHIHAAVLHFFLAKQVSELDTKESLIIASKILPTMFKDNMYVVTLEEVSEALFNSSKQCYYIDKRIIIHLVKEVFSEIYSCENYLEHMPWIHPSLMIKKNYYTMWRGDKPPESFDLVSKIVWERISQLFKYKDIFLGEYAMKSRENFNNSKISKWCFERQNNYVDKLLIKDLSKEENDWVYYDNSEEKVKFQIAEDIFQGLINDTTLWFISTRSKK